MIRRFFLLAMIAGLSGCSSTEYIAQRSHRIIFFGDSITQQGAAPDGYVSLVRDSLAALGYSYEVIGAGISGNKISDLLSRADNDVLSKQPTIVVIYIGINDVWHFEFTSRGLSGTPKDKFESGLNELIGKLRSAGAQIILCTPSVIGEKKNGANKYDSMLDEYSTISRRVAAETGSALCDLRNAFREHLESNNPSDAEKEVLTTDGVHLNNAGNRFVAAQMMKAIDGMGLFFPLK
jgi:lysophospholipase L1-like esterase